MSASAVPSSCVLPCMVAQARAAEEALVRALEEVRLAAGYAEAGNRNACAGTLMCVEPALQAALSLVGASLVLHRFAPAR